MNQNFSESFWADAVLSGRLYAPAGDVGEPFVDADDIADVVVAALTEGKHAGQLYEVTGPRLLTFSEALEEIGRATGRSLTYVPVTPEQFRDGLVQEGVPEDFAAHLTDVFVIVLDGRNAFVTDGVERALGRPPRDFQDYARETAATGIWTGSGVAAWT
jgi:uncharacterized protein YbjT (DUF2867 family)